MNSKPSVALETGLDLSEVLTTGSILRLNEVYNDADVHEEHEKLCGNSTDFIGTSVKSFAEFEKDMVKIDTEGYVKKRIIEEGGGFLPEEDCTLSIAYTGYWENEPEPFEIRTPAKPLAVDLKDSGLLPGLQTAVKSMLVGELSVFLLSYQVMYGEFGVPPRIKPKADCVFYVKLIKSIINSKKGKLDLKAPNIFNRVLHEVKLLYASGNMLYSSNNFPAAIQVFQKGVYMLHNCRLADENEERRQEKMLKKIYINLAICCNQNKKPLKACVACNELNRLNALWNNGKALYQNAKALRMIGSYKDAERRLNQAKKLCPDKKEIDEEIALLQRVRLSCDQEKLLSAKCGKTVALLTDDFKKEVDNLIRNFKQNDDICKLVLPEGMNADEIAYVKQTCIRENLFFNKIKQDYALNKENDVNNEVTLGEM